MPSLTGQPVPRWRIDDERRRATNLLRGLAVLFLFVAGCRSTERTLFSEGQEHLERQECAEAYDAFTRYISLYPQAPEAYYDRGLAAIGLGKLDQALIDFDRVIRFKPDDTNARWMRYKIRAERLNELREAAGAIGPLLQPMEQTMESAQKVLMLEELNMILKIDAYDFAAFAERGSLLRSLGRYEEAKHDLDIVLLNTPDDVWALNERGRLMHDLGDYASAIRDYDAALSNCDSCTWLLYNKALSLSANGQSQEAAAVLSALVAVDSLDAGAWLMLGECNATLGRRDEACAALARSAALGMVEAKERLEEVCR